MKRATLLTAVLTVVVLFAMSTNAMAVQHFTANSKGTLSPVMEFVDNVSLPEEVTGSVAVTINARSIGESLGRVGEPGSEAYEYRASGVVRVDVDVTTLAGIELDLHLNAPVKKVLVDTAPNPAWYSLACQYKGEMYWVSVSLYPGYEQVFLQLLAPYLGTYSPDPGPGWSYMWLPIANGDFSFTYNP